MNSPLDADNLEAHASPEGIIVDMTVLGYLRSSGYPVNEVRELYTVSREGSETGHLVAEIETLQKPRDDPELDVVSDKITIHVCDCWNFQASHWPDLREYGNSPDDAGECTHIQQVTHERRTD